MIDFRLAERLAGRSLYWLAKESGIAYSTIHKLQKEPPHGISFETLDKLCAALGCEPGDLLVRSPGTKGNQRSRKTLPHPKGVGK